MMEAGKHCSKLLELAAIDDLPSFVHEVEKSGCDIDEVSFWYGRSFGSKKMGFEERTPLMVAALYGSTEVLKYVLQSGKVDVNRACGGDKATALHCAAGGGSWPSIEIVRLLINASGDVNAVNADGKKVADLIPICVKSSARKTMETLLNGGVTVTTQVVEKREYPMDIPLPDINNGIYGTDEFRMYNFKVNPCSRAYSHDWTECPFVHPGENARRRDPRKYQYTCVPCPEFKKGICAKADACEYAHGVFESWLHPAQYRTRMCKDETGCRRKVCFFAHKQEELRPLYAATGSAMPSPKPTVTPGGSRLKAALSSRDLELDLKPTNLDDLFRSIDPLLQMQSPTGPQIRQSFNQLRASYPARNCSALNFDSAAAVAAAVMNSRSSSAFTKRSQSFIDRTGAAYRPSLMPSKLSDWGSPNGKLDWGFNDEEANKLRKSASFGIRSGNAAAMAVRNAEANGGAWQLHGGVNEMMPNWIEQMYMEQEQMVA